MNPIKKARRNGAPPHLFIVIAAILCGLTSLTAPIVQAIIEVPPDNDIFFQTTGEQGDIGIGDYYSSQAGDNNHHLVGINIPCLPNQIYRIELFDPELYDAGAPGIGTETVDDEVRPLANPGTPVGDQTHFILRQPNGTTVLADVVFGPHDPAGPAPATHNSWVIFGTITLPSTPVKGDTCGSYTIEVWTGDEAGVAELNDDDNAWKHRILGNPDAAGNETFQAELGPDGRLGTGDEVWLDVELLSYQHNTTAAQSFYWFVDDGVTRTWIGRNFDIDIGTNLCNNVPCELTYIAPSGNVFPASLSGNQLWNPGQPDRGPGDLFTDAEAGLWRVDILMPVNNQYIIEIENNSKPIFLEQPILPDVIIAKDDGLTLVQSPGVTTYTIVATNTGKGPALSVLGPEVVDTLPVGMAFAGCAINPPLEGTCAESTPGSGIINFELNPQSLALNSDGSPFGPILAYLPGVSSGLTNTGRLQVSANIAPGLLDGTLLTNTVTIDWTDTYNNDYPTRSDDDIDFVQASAPTPTPSVTPTPTPTLTPTPTFISTSTPTDDDDDPTSTPQGSTPVAPTPLPGTPVAGLVLDAGATTPVLPVNFLPETGLRAAKQPQISAGQMSLMLALGGLSATMFCLWLRSKRKD